MSDEKTVDFTKLKQTYGDLVVIDLDGKPLAFKRLTKAQITDMKKRITDKPALVVEITINCCSFNCVYGSEYFDELSAKYPLAFCGNEGDKGVIDWLMDLARGGSSGPSIRVV